VLLRGGLDSTTCLAIGREECQPARILTHPIRIGKAYIIRKPSLSARTSPSPTAATTRRPSVPRAALVQAAPCNGRASRKQASPTPWMLPVPRSSSKPIWNVQLSGRRSPVKPGARRCGRTLWNRLQAVELRANSCPSCINMLCSLLCYATSIFTNLVRLS
jgi:hypothetical protein